MATSKQSTKKPVSKTVSRNVTSSKPRLLQVLVGLLLVLALVFLGTIGYAKWKENDLKAKAARWTPLKIPTVVNGTGDGVKPVACKQYQGSAAQLADDSAAKKATVTAVVSKPAGLKFTGVNNGQAIMTLHRWKKETVTKAGKTDFGYQWQDSGSKTLDIWWGNTVSTAQITDVNGGDKVAVTINSDKSTSLPTGQTISTPLRSDVNGTKYLRPPEPLYYTNAKDYQAAQKNWEKQTLSIAKIINCEGSR